MAELYRDNRTFFGVHDDTWIAIALWTILSKAGIGFNINRIINSLIGTTVIWDTLIIGGLSTLFIVLGTAIAIKKMQRREFLLMMFIATLYFLSYVFNGKSRQLLDGTFFVNIFIYGFAAIVCVANFKDWKKFQTVGIPFILVGLASFLFLSYRIIVDSFFQDYMSFSYANLVFVIGAFWIAIYRRNVIMWIVAPVALVLLLITGSRGALLCALVYIVIEFVINKKIHIVFKILFFIAVAFIYFNIEEVMIAFDSVLKQYGYYSRTISKFFEGTLQDDSGRSDHYKYAWEIVMENPLFGKGMAGAFTTLFEKVHGYLPIGKQMTYSHNLFLDLYMQYGIFGGTFTSVWLVYNLIKSYIKGQKKNTENVLLVFASIIFPRLMVSATYLEYPEFFMLLGLMINLCYVSYDDKVN